MTRASAVRHITLLSSTKVANSFYDASFGHISASQIQV